MGEAPLTQHHSTQACQEAIEQIKQELDQATRVQTPTKEVLGMNKIIGDDSLRRALAAIAPAPKAAHNEQERAAQQAQAVQAEPWMQAQLRHSIANATQTVSIRDCDTTVKVLYGHQEGAVVSYNPQKPRRPSHTIHTDWIGKLRLVLDAQLQAGNRHSPSCGRCGLKALLESLPGPQRRKLLDAVGKLTSHARVNKIVLVMTHEAGQHIQAMIANTHAGVQHIRSAAPQLRGHQRWFALAPYIADKILAFVPNTNLPETVATG